VEHALSLDKGSKWVVCRSSAKLHPNHWYYIVGTLTVGDPDADGLILRLYVNGTKEDEEASDKGTQHQPGGLDRFCIGGESGGGYGPFIGAIGDVSVWQVPLAQESINNTWFNRVHPEYHDTNLVGHWKMNEGALPAGSEASAAIVSSAAIAPPWDVARTNAVHVYDYSIYSNQGVVLGRPRSSATTVPIYHRPGKQEVK